MTKGRLLRFWGWFKILKDDAVILHYAWKHPRTPGYIKGLLIVMITYLFSPVDILPDYLPVLGIADDLALIPAAIVYLAKMLPASVLADCQKESYKWRGRIPLFLGVALVLMITWVIIVIIGFSYLLSKLSGR